MFITRQIGNTVTFQLWVFYFLLKRQTLKLDQTNEAHIWTVGSLLYWKHFVSSVCRKNWLFSRNLNLLKKITSFPLALKVRFDLKTSLELLISCSIPTRNVFINQTTSCLYEVVHFFPPEWPLAEQSWTTTTTTNVGRSLIRVIIIVQLDPCEGLVCIGSGISSPYTNWWSVLMFVYYRFVWAWLCVYLLNIFITLPRN